MAKLVAAVATPHAPMLPQQVLEKPGQLRAEALMGQVRKQLEAAAPDVIITVASDHFTSFFFDNLPQFCVGTFEAAAGPTESYCRMPRRVVRGVPDLARGFLKYSLESNFDLAFTEEMGLDHSVLVPLHFLVHDTNIPVVPININALAPPLPSSRRAFNLGRALGRFIERWPGQQRVALLASGSISLEVGGPRVGITDHRWVNTVSKLLEQGNYASIVRRATEQRMLAAGNVSGEFLCWITMCGALGESRPVFVEPDEGSAFVAWRLED